MGDSEGESGEEEASRVKLYPAPGEPTEQERRAHEVTHMPYRSWCKHCVFGKAHALPHAAQDHSGDSVPTVALDYKYARHTVEGSASKARA